MALENFPISGLKPDPELLAGAPLPFPLPRLRPNAPGAERVLQALRDLLPPGRFRRTAAALEAMAGSEGERDFFQLL